MEVIVTVFRCGKLFSPSPSANAVGGSSSKVTSFKLAISQTGQKSEMICYQVFAVAPAGSNSTRSARSGSQSFASR